MILSAETGLITYSKGRSGESIPDEGSYTQTEKARIEREKIALYWSA